VGGVGVVSGGFMVDVGGRVLVRVGGVGGVGVKGVGVGGVGVRGGLFVSCLCGLRLRWNGG